MKKFLHNVVERIKSRREGRTDTQYQIVWNAEGVHVDWLTVENTRGSVAFSWDSVRTVDTFKRDLFMVDCICLAFQTTDGWIEINEDMRGWRDFLAAVESSLPGFPLLSDWYGKVMLPPFEANHATL
jgi:hypothetical protein